MATLLLSLWSVLALVWSRSQNMPACVCENSSQLPASVRRLLFKTHQIREVFFCYCRLEISSRPRDVFGMRLECWHISFHVIFMVKHACKSTELLPGWTDGVSQTKESKQLWELFSSVLFVIISEMIFFGVLDAHLKEGEVQLKARLPFVFHIKPDPLARAAQDMFV